jgi:transaldolase/glucose-6-phosphate isomerase
MEDSSWVRANPSSLVRSTIADLMLEKYEELSIFLSEMSKTPFTSVVLIDVNGYSYSYASYISVDEKNKLPSKLFILDEIDPSFINQIDNKIDLKNTLFLISSTSGSTLEVIGLYKYYWEKVYLIKGDNAGENFIAITSDGSGLMKIAQEKKFSGLFIYPNDVWGHLRAITYPGILPAELVGIKTKNLLENYSFMAKISKSCGVHNDPSIYLGALLSEFYQLGIDKLTIVSSQSLKSLGCWIEGIVSEMLGKKGRGLIPITDGIPSDFQTDKVHDSLGNDKIFIFLRHGNDYGLDKIIGKLCDAKKPVLVFDILDKHSIGQEYFRWMLALLVTAYFLDVHPYSEPELSLISHSVKRLIENKNNLDNYNDAQHLGIYDLIKSIGRKEYLAIQAFVPRNLENEYYLVEIQKELFIHLKIPVILSYGPNCLHSIGQVYNGGKNCGAFIQIVSKPEKDFFVPGFEQSFGEIKKAQVLANFNSLLKNGRHIVKIDIGIDVQTELSSLLSEIRGLLKSVNIRTSRKNLRLYP